MVIGRFYHTGTNLGRQPLNQDAHLDYSIRGDIAYVCWRGKKCRTHLKRGEVYSVIGNRHGLPEIKHDLPPQHPADVLMWILGFPKSARTYQWNTFDSRLAKCRTCPRDPKYQEYHMVGLGYDFAYLTHSTSRLATPLVAYIDEGLPIDADFVRELLTAVLQSGIHFGQLSYPSSFAQRIFRQYLNFTASDWHTTIPADSRIFPA